MLVEGGITPSGTKNITENGTYDVTNYATANVNLRFKRVTKNLTSDITSAGRYKFIENDPDLIAHKNDDTLVIILRNTQPSTNVAAIHYINCGNIAFNTVCGTYLRAGNTGSVVSATMQNPLKTVGSSSLTLYITSNGDLEYYVSSSYPLRAGLWEILIGW